MTESKAEVLREHLIGAHGVDYAARALWYRDLSAMEEIHAEDHADLAAVDYVPVHDPESMEVPDFPVMSVERANAKERAWRRAIRYAAVKQA